jgi:hypothetical protein
VTEVGGLKFDVRTLEVVDNQAAKGRGGREAGSALYEIGAGNNGRRAVGVD